MIAFDAVTVTTHDGVSLLDDVTTTIPDGRTAIIGPNGAGKTTLARLINGLARTSAGTVTVDDRDVASHRREVQRRVGFVFAEADHQLVYPTPLEDVALGVRARGRSRAQAREAAQVALAAVGVADRADQAIHTLSGGEKHLVALAAVLALEPDWVVLDEPTTTLDLVNRHRVIEVLLGLPHRLVIVTHDLDLAERLDRAILMGSGTVVAEGEPASVVATYRGLVPS